MGILRSGSVTIKTILCAVFLAFVSCMNMMSNFNRVDANKLRVIGVTFSPKPEIAPGDTVTVTAYLGGNAVVSLSDFSLAHKAIWTMDGVTFTDAYPIEPVSRPHGMPDSAQFSFVIKPDAFIGRQVYDSMPQAVIDSVARLFMKGRDSVGVILSSLSDSEKVSLGTTVNRMVLPAALLFTAHSLNGTSLKVEAVFSIKYHEPLPKVTPPNNNPDISWVGICKVPDRYALGFSPFDSSVQGKFKLTYLFNSKNPVLVDSIIEVDTGCAYFLVADDGVTRSAGRIDTTRDTMTDKNGVLLRESFNYKWFYQNVDTVTDIEDSLMEIDNNSAPCIEMKPPYNTAMKRFNVWVAVYDEMKNQWARPRGMCVRAVHGVFRFSDAYIKVMSQK
jgi:hypothetical protein